MSRRFPPSLLPTLIVGGLILSLTACSYLPFHLGKPAADAKPATASQKPGSHGLVVEMRVAPDPLKLADNRQINVTFILRNVSPKKAQLKFPTTQVIELLLRDAKTNQIVSQWSSDQAFTSDPRLLLINSQERIEYNETLSTRDMKAGTLYLLEGYVVGFEQELRATKAVLPAP